MRLGAVPAPSSPDAQNLSGRQTAAFCRLQSDGTREPLSAARAGTGLSQEEVARLLGVSKRTLQEWEQGRKRPSGAARVLLRIAARRPDLLREYTS